MEDCSEVEDPENVFLEHLRETFMPTTFSDLKEKLAKENLLDTLKGCCRECHIEKSMQTWECISTVLIHITKTAQQFVNDQEPCNNGTGNQLLMTLCRVLMSSFVESLQSEYHEKVLSCIKYVMKKVSTDLVILCASHMKTDGQTRKTAQDILCLVCKCCKSNSVSELLSGIPSQIENTEEKRFFQHGVLPGILDVLYLKMENCPTSPQVIYWCVMQIQYPNVGAHLSKLLPTLLKLIDNHQISSKIVGVKCLHHVMKNTNAAEVLWYGRANVIYEVLQRLLYINEPSLLDVLYPSILDVLQIMEPLSKRTDNETKQSDSVMQTILTSMEYETNIQMRRVHAAHLEKFIGHMGIHLLRYFKRFLVVVFSYLEVYGDQKEDIRINIVQALKTAILHVWPRIGLHAEEIMKALLKLIVDCCDSVNNGKDELLGSCVECIVILRYCSPDHVTEALKTIENEIQHTKVRECVAKILSGETADTLMENINDLTAQ